MARTEVHPYKESGTHWLLRTTVRNTPAIVQLAGARSRPTELERTAEWLIPATAEAAQQLRATLPDARWTKAAAKQRRELAEARKGRITLQTVHSEPLEIEADKTLAPFQANGVDWLFSNSGILADDMGLGKTVQLSLAANQMRWIAGSIEVLVLCPTSAIGVWEQHLEEWTQIKPFIFHGPQRKRVYEQYLEHDGAKALVSTHGLLDKHSYQVNYGSAAKQGKEGEFNNLYDLLIIDEAHRVGVDPFGKRVRAAVATSRTADRVWVSTGTPVNDQPRDLWVLMQYVAPEVFGSYATFCKRYCIEREGKWGKVNLGLHLDMEPEYEWVIKPWMLRRLKKTHGAEIPDALPPQVIELEMTGPQAKAYRQVVAENLTLIEQANGNRELVYAEGKLPQSTLLQYLAAGVPVVEGGKVTELQPRNSNKLSYLVEVAEDRAGDPFVVYAYSAREVTMYQEGLEKAGFTTGIIKGKTPRVQRDATVRLFQAGKLDVLLVTNSGGDSITLTAADLIILARPSWRPLENQQVMDRINRWGQTRNPQTQILVSIGTVDETRLRSLAGKIDLQEEMTLDKKRLKNLLTGKS